MTDRGWRAMLTLLGAVVVLACSGAPALAAGSSGYCQGSTSAGAVNQYCEDLPNVGGGQPISPRSKALAATLPSAVLTRILAHGAPTGSRALLTIPAAAKSSPPVRSHTEVAAVTPPASGHASTPELWLAAVVAGVIVLGGLDALRRRRHRSG